VKARLLPIFLVFALRAGAEYVPPEETGDLFARAALPVDTDMMRELSGQLAVLAQRPTAGDPVQQRATAQLVAMATRLDPTNWRARDINHRLSKGRDVPAAEPQEFQDAKSRTWEIAQWLLDEETGDTGRLVGSQIVDALRVVDPGHPAVHGHQAGGENQRWKGVVAPLHRFRGRMEPPEPKPPRPKPPEPEPPEPEPTPPVPRPPAPPVLLTDGAVLTPFEVVAGQSHSIELVRLSLRVSESAETAELDLRLVPEPGTEAALTELRSARDRILGALTEKWGRLPEHRLATLESEGNLPYSPRNGTAFSGPATLLLASAISGQALRDDVVFFGDITPDGLIHNPEFAWRYLGKLRDGKGGRLIVPGRFEPQIRALLALEEPDFFIRYEVLAASTLGQALSMAAADPGSPILAQTDQDFARFREVTAPASIGPLAVNGQVRERLTKILTANPNHWSAKMILLQGSSWRPTRLDRVTLTMELRRCLEPIDWMFGGGTEAGELDASRLTAAFDSCRKDLEALQRRVDRSDKKLYDESRAIVDTLPTLAGLSAAGAPEATDRLVEIFGELRLRHERLLQSFQAPRPAQPDQAGKN
jgi:hypothetical protein